MKRGVRIIAGFLLATLAACNAGSVLTYTVETDTQDSAKNAALYQASERVIVRKLAGVKIDGVRAEIIPSFEGPATLTVSVPNANAAEATESLLKEPFTFDLRLEQPGATGAPEDVQWLPTGVDGSVLDWVRPVTDPSGEIGVELQFSPEGRVLLEEAFKGNTGENIGIFVRDLLVSKMQISTESISEHIIIGGIPSAGIAEVFADDVNVGLHVLFTPSS